MEIEVLDDGFKHEKVEESIRDIIRSNKLLSMATTAGEEPHINTAFYAFDDQFRLYIWTPPETEHGKNLEENDSVAVDIHDSRQEFPDEKQGLQLFGSCRKAENREEVLEIYSERFPETREFASNVEELEELDSEFYIIEPSRIKIFDELRFGKETWVEVEVNQTNY